VTRCIAGLAVALLPLNRHAARSTTMTLLRAVSLAAILTATMAGAGMADTPNGQANAQNTGAATTQSKAAADQSRQATQGNPSAASPTTGSGTSVGPGAGGDTANTPLGYAKGAGESSQVGKQR
jgi:hypothetical protein